MRLVRPRLFWASLLVALAFVVVGEARGNDEATMPVQLSSDEVVHDRGRGLITARGDVIITQNERILSADMISYNQNTNLLTANGNISLLEPSGEVIFARHMELAGDLKSGAINTLRMIFQDGARLAAISGERRNGNLTNMSRVVYSPCKICAEDPEPLWQIKAVKVIHDQKEKEVTFEDATLELGGFAIAYTPILSIPDSTVKRKTGFLAPVIGNRTSLGMVVRAPFYWVIDDTSDVTLEPILTTKEGSALLAGYRKQFSGTRLDVEAGSASYGSETNSAHLFVNGETHFDDTWRGSYQFQRTSHDTYMRRYGFNNLSSLTTSTRLEGFRGRNYASVEALTFQGLLAEDRSSEIPVVFPLAEYRLVGTSDRWGGRPEVDLNLLSLTRKDGADTRRLISRLGWQATRITSWGDIWKLGGALRLDFYNTNGYRMPGSADKRTGFTHRTLPEVSLEWRRPMVKTGRRYHQVLEPIVSLITAPNGGNSNRIPNEDSVTFEFDDTNLFSNNRFGGYDRVEGGTRVNYGIRWGVFGDTEGSTSITLGQSYRLNPDNSLPKNTGLEDRFSDVVGRIHVSPSSWLDVFYRTRLGKDDLSPVRNEAAIKAGVNAIKLDLSYLFLEADEGTDFSDRKELKFGLSSQMSRHWRAGIKTTFDLARNSELREAAFDLIYEDECFLFSTTLERHTYRDRDLVPDNSIMLRLTFKTLGEIGGSKF